LAPWIAQHSIQSPLIGTGRIARLYLYLYLYLYLALAGNRQRELFFACDTLASG
jgi:hypothetical protein